MLYFAKSNRLAMSSKTRTILTVIGFFFFISGFLSIFLAAVGINLTMFSWMNKAFGNGPAFLLHIARVVVGVVMIYLSRVNFEE
jgi:hypothetical protein